ncbi:MAG: TrmO family methyltransferase [Anaerolineales bacterium]
MDEVYQVKPIGFVQIRQENISIHLEQEYHSGLSGLEGFSHLQVLWWAHRTDSAENRQRLVLGKPFRMGPDRLGIFATRSPARPNPVMVSIIEVDEIDDKEGILYPSFLDADDGTPVMDIRPYFAMERVRDCQVPDWCRHWPQWYEEQMTFDWRQEIESL